MGATRALVVEIDTELAALVPGFLDRRRSDAVAIRAAALSGDFETARSLGHQLKGSGASYGFPELSRLGAEVEEAAKGHERERLGGLADALSEYLGSIRINYV